MDWIQVVLNGGPPCFHICEDGRFCGRAERWEGHEDLHKFTSLADMVRAIAPNAKLNDGGGGKDRNQWWQEWCTAFQMAREVTQYGIGDAAEEILDVQFKRLLNAAFPPNSDFREPAQ